MIELYVNESEEMTFDMSIGGARADDVDARLFIKMDEMSLVFPAKVNRDTVNIKIPALDNMLKKGLNEGDVYDARVEVVVNETTLIPWQGQVKIKKPVSVKLEMAEVRKVAEDLKLDIKVGNPKVKVKPKVEEKEVEEMCGPDHDEEDKDKKKKKKSKIAEIFK